MPLDPKEVARLVNEENVVFICAACQHFHEGRDRGLIGCGRHDSCGTPMTGAPAPDYEGPVSESYRKSTCWACGQDADAQVRFLDESDDGSDRVLGVCEDHVDYVSQDAIVVTDSQEGT